VIELRFFTGLSVEETAEVLKVSPGTVMRDWKLGRAWLLAHFPHKFWGMFVLSVGYGPDRLFVVTTIVDRVE